MNVFVRRLDYWTRSSGTHKNVVRRGGSFAQSAIETFSTKVHLIARLFWFWDSRLRGAASPISCVHLLTRRKKKKKELVTLLCPFLLPLPPRKFFHPFVLPCGKRNEQLLGRSSIRDRSIYIETVPGVATNFITLDTLHGWIPSATHNLHNASIRPCFFLFVSFLA